MSTIARNGTDDLYRVEQRFACGRDNAGLTGYPRIDRAGDADIGEVITQSVAGCCTMSQDVS